MTVIRVAGFSGENRAMQPQLLPEDAATVSLNHKPGRGDLRPWKAPLDVATVPSGRKTIHRMQPSAPNELLDTQYWLSWTSRVHAVRGFNGTTELVYFTGDGAPKMADNTVLDGTDPQANPATTYLLGLPAPTNAPTVATTGTLETGDALETYYYVYTFVNALGWESAPSPVSSANTRGVNQGATVSVFNDIVSGAFKAPTSIRVYRTQAGTTGSAGFFYMGEVTYADTTFSDVGQNMGEVCATTTWLPAPGVPTGGAEPITESNLTNLTALWNGMKAGITDGAVRFCEAHVPYAWPIGYDVVPPSGKAVALGVVGQQLLVLTDGRPLLVAGSSPDSMDAQPLEIPQACVSAASVVSMGFGVVWASMDGLMFYAPGGARNLTAGVMTRDDWLGIKPETIVGQMYEGRYLGSYLVGGVRKGFIIDPAGGGIYFLSTGYEAMYFDEQLDQLFVLDGTTVKRWDAGAALEFTWKSKVFYKQFPTQMACAKLLTEATGSAPVTFKLWADGALIHTQTVTDSQPFRLPSGIHTNWQFEVSGTSSVQAIVMGGSMAELVQ